MLRLEVVGDLVRRRVVLELRSSSEGGGEGGGLRREGKVYHDYNFSHSHFSFFIFILLYRIVHFLALHVMFFPYRWPATCPDDVR